MYWVSKDMKRVFALLTILFIVITSGGCSSKATKKKITVMWWGDIYNMKFAQKLIDAYNSTSPQIPAGLLSVQGDYNSKMLTMAASNTLPDVVLMLTRDVLNLGKRKVLLSMNDYAGDDKDFSKMETELWTGLLDAVRLDGELLAIPIWTWTPGIYYNKDLFDTARIPYPSKDWTWDEFREIAIRLTRKDENGRTLIYAVESLNMHFNNFVVLSCIYGYGGRLYSDDRKKCEITSPETIESLKWLFELKLKHGIAPTYSQQASSETRGLLADIFQAGRAAMQCAGRDHIDVMNQGGGGSFRWGVAPMPRVKQKINFQSPAYLAVSRLTKYPDDAWRFIHFAISEAGQRIIAEDRSDVTVLKKLTYQEGFLNYQGKSEENVLFRDMLLGAVPAPNLFVKDEWGKFAYDQFQLVELKNISLETACVNIERAYKP